MTDLTERKRLTYAVLPAGTRVFLDGRIGTLEGYESVGIARVLWDDSQTPIAIHVSRLRPEIQPHKRRRGSEQDRIVAERRLIRSAFDLIRCDLSQSELKHKLVDALGGRIDRTPELIAEVQRIIGERGQS